MNKAQLVDALVERLGDRRTAATAVDGMLETIVDAVRGGDSVSLTGFGVFEGRARAARVARNPRTGEPVPVAATTVPAFRPGAGFRSAVGGGAAPAPRATPRRTPAAAADTAPVTPAPEIEVEAPAKSSGKKQQARSDASFAAQPAAAGKAPKAAKAPKSVKVKSEKPEKAKAGKGKESAAEKPKRSKAKK